MTYRLTPLAITDLDDIAEYIARHDPGAARRLLARLERKFEMLGKRPKAGRARPELRPDLRSTVLDSYLILDRAIDGGAEIVRVVHGARNISDLV